VDECKPLLGGKGTAKKWRQSLRLITMPGFRQGETMVRRCRLKPAATRVESALGL